MMDLLNSLTNSGTITGIIVLILAYFGYNYAATKRQNEQLKKQKEIAAQEAKFDEIRKTTASRPLDDLIGEHNTEINSRKPGK